MLGDKIRVQSKVDSNYTDDQLLMIKQMGVDTVFVIFKDEDSNYTSVLNFKKRLENFGLEMTDAGNVGIYKSDKIHLGLPGRDGAIEKYNEFNRVLASVGVKTGYMTWEPNQVLTTKFDVGRYTRGAVGRIVELNELEKRSYTHDKFYSQEEIWDNFAYYLDKVMPVCNEIGMRIALHPNDPPTDNLCGISNLITSAQSYKKAFTLADDNPNLGMKLCTGCWLEGGKKFGNLLEDIKYFVTQKKVFSVHFRNVSSPLPNFEETLLEDGYMDMYEVMKQLVRYDYDGVIHVDHVPHWPESLGGENPAWTYSTGYMKALLNCAKAELN